MKKTRLDNGLTVISDNIDGFETASIGLFVNVGSVNENDRQTGISHFLEHMAFKGTKTRSALDISYAIESVGGVINAYTSKEVTAFHAKVLKNDVQLALDIITDIVQNSTFDKAEFDKERGVIIQEIRQTNDSPDDYVFDMFQSKCFDGERLGTSILGSEKDILSFEPSDMREYLTSKYSPDKMVLSAAGRIDHDALVELATDFTKGMQSFQTEAVEKQTYRGGFIAKQKDLEQTHLIFGFEGLSHTHDDRYTLSILSTILGGGMSSRLFQEIREKRGLVYAVFSFASNYRDTGAFGVYAACEDSKVKEVIDITRDELLNVGKDITADEVEKAKTQMKASLLMGLESSSARMERLAMQFLLHGKVSSPDEVVQKIDAVSVDKIKTVAERTFGAKPTLAVIGKGQDFEALNEFA